MSDGALEVQGGLTVEVLPDEDAPRPDPTAWEMEPELNGDVLAASMTAVEAIDRSGVEYYFEELAGHPGGRDSGWQASPHWTDANLQHETVYRYRVRVRDLSAAPILDAPEDGALASSASMRRTLHRTRRDSKPLTTGPWWSRGR